MSFRILTDILTDILNREFNAAQDSKETQAYDLIYWKNEEMCAIMPPTQKHSLFH